jgi:hypothetical protein
MTRRPFPGGWPIPDRETVSGSQGNGAAIVQHSLNTRWLKMSSPLPLGSMARPLWTTGNFPISTSALRSITYAVCWMDTVGASFIGTCGSERRKPTLKRFWNAPRRSTLKRNRESSPKWGTVHRSGFQGIYSHLGHDARPHLALLSAVEPLTENAASPFPAEPAHFGWLCLPCKRSCRRLLTTLGGGYSLR